jgi:hypothetical protein
VVGAVYYLLVARAKEFPPVITPAAGDPPLVPGAAAAPGAAGHPEG